MACLLTVLVCNPTERSQTFFSSLNPDIANIVQSFAAGCKKCLGTPLLRYTEAEAEEEKEASEMLATSLYSESVADDEIGVLDVRIGVCWVVKMLKDSLGRVRTGISNSHDLFGHQSSTHTH